MKNPVKPPASAKAGALTRLEALDRLANDYLPGLRAAKSKLPASVDRPDVVSMRLVAAESKVPHDYLNREGEECRRLVKERLPELGLEVRLPPRENESHTLKDWKDIVIARILVANQHPKLLDESGALAGREIVILFEKSFAKVVDPDLTDKLKAELSGIANWAIEGLKRLRASKGQFTLEGRALKAIADIKQDQSTALRFAAECLQVTHDPDDVLPLALAYRAYAQWAADVEGLSPGKRRDRTGFKDDMLAALRKHGVEWAKNQIRWHDPLLERAHGQGERIERRFVGLKLKARAHPDIQAKRAEDDFGGE